MSFLFSWLQFVVLRTVYCHSQLKPFDLEVVSKLEWHVSRHNAFLVTNKPFSYTTSLRSNLVRQQDFSSFFWNPMLVFFLFSQRSGALPSWPLGRCQLWYLSRLLKFEAKLVWERCVFLHATPFTRSLNEPNI